MISVSRAKCLVIEANCPGPCWAPPISTKNMLEIISDQISLASRYGNDFVTIEFPDVIIKEHREVIIEELEKRGYTVKAKDDELNFIDIDWGVFEKVKIVINKE